MRPHAQRAEHTLAWSGCFMTLLLQVDRDWWLDMASLH